jgi:hypothetical protein
MSEYDWLPEPMRTEVVGRIAANEQRYREYELALDAERAEILRHRAEVQSTMRWRFAHGWYWFWYCYWPLVLFGAVVAAVIVTAAVVR